MPKAFFLIPVLASTLTLAASTGAFAQTDPAALVQHYLEALARGDVAGALALYVEDAVFDGGLCAAALCVGKAAIQKALERLVADKTHVHTTLTNYVSGNVVTSRFEVRNATIKQAGVERIMGWWIVETHGEKIAYLRAGILDRSDPQTARYTEWQQAQPPTR